LFRTLQIFQSTDPITEEEALKATQVLVKTIYSSENQEPEAGNLQGLVRDVCEECIQVLREPEKSQAKPAIKVLSAFVTTTRSFAGFPCYCTFTHEAPMGTASVSRYTMSQAVPHLVKLFLNPDEVSNRLPVLQLLSDLITAARDSRDNIKSKEGVNIPLSPFKDEVLGVVTVSLKNVGSRRSAIAVVMGMITTEGLMSDEELGFIVHNVNEILGADPQISDDARYSQTYFGLFLVLSMLHSLQ